MDEQRRDRLIRNALTARRLGIAMTFSVAELGLVLRCSRSVLYRLEAQGSLPAFRTPGGHRRYRLEAIWPLLVAFGIVPEEPPEPPRRFEVVP